MYAMTLINNCQKIVAWCCGVILTLPHVGDAERFYTNLAVLSQPGFIFGIVKPALEKKT